MGNSNNPLFGFEASMPTKLTKIAEDGLITTAWYSLLRAVFERTGGGNGIPTYNGASIADAGASQATATPLVPILNFCTFSGKGVALPAAMSGNEFVVVVNVNGVAGNVYPAKGGQIDSLGANNPYVCPAGTTIFWYAAPLQCYSAPFGRSPGLLNTLTANNSASLSDTTSLLAPFSVFQLDLIDIIPANNAVDLELQVHSGGAFKTTTYLGSSLTFSGAAANWVTTTTFIPLSGTGGSVANTGNGVSGRIRVYNPSKTTNPKRWVGEVGYTQSGQDIPTPVGGFWNGGNGAVDGFRIQFSGGNISSGVVRVSGVL